MGFAEAARLREKTLPFPERNDPNFRQELQIIQELTEEFKRCSTALSAIGDETRQSIILALLEGAEDGRRVGEITESVSPVSARRLPSLEGFEGRGHRQRQAGRHHELLLPQSPGKHFDPHPEPHVPGG